MTERATDILRISPEDYFRYDLNFRPLVWEPEMDLKAGTVVRLQHKRPDSSRFVFECNGKGGRFTTGLLSILTEDGLSTNRQPATISVVHPAIALAQANMPYVEFTFEAGERKTRINPAFDRAEVL